MKRTIGIIMVLLMLMSVTCAWAGNAKDAQVGCEKVKVIIGYVDKPNQADEDMIRVHGGETKYTYRIPSKLEGKWGYYLKINNLLLRLYTNSVLNRAIGVNLNLKSIRKCY